jgi:hypothetical protein
MQFSVVSEEQYQADMVALESRMQAFTRELIKQYLPTEDEWVDWKKAMVLIRVKARTTLVRFARASQPGVQEEGKITYRKEGTKCWYLRTSCIDYRQRRHGQPALTA